MLHEFALDPAAVAGWSSREAGRFAIDAFRTGSARVPACLPGKWRKMVWNSFHSRDQNASKRLEALIGYLAARASGRQAASWDGAAAWLDNALREHNRAPFQAIITTAHRPGVPCVLCEDDLEPTNALWQVARSRTVGRRAAEYASALRGLISAARQVLIVEPVFDPQDTRFTTTLEAIAGLEPIATGRVTPCLIVRSDGRSPPAEMFRKRCAQYLPRRLPGGASLQVLYAEQKHGGERLHNRLIITDVASVLLGDSIDEGNAGETNDLALLDEEHHRARLAAYSNAEEVFDVTSRFRLSGSAPGG